MPAKKPRGEKDFKIPATRITRLLVLPWKQSLAIILSVKRAFFCIRKICRCETLCKSILALVFSTALAWVAVVVQRLSTHHMIEKLWVRPLPAFSTVSFFECPLKFSSKCASLFQI